MLSWGRNHVSHDGTQNKKIMENTKTFEELITINEELRDKRYKAFKELKHKLLTEYMPALRKAMQSCEWTEVCFKLDNKPFNNFDKRHSYDGDDFYLLFVDADNEDVIEGRVISTYDNGDDYVRCEYKSSYKYDSILNECIIELTKKIKKKIESINNYMEREISSCNELV